MTHAARVVRGSSPSHHPAEREDERRRLARELHDGPAQSLAAALFGVDLALAALDRRPRTARDELAQARELVRDALSDVRGMMAGLRPRVLEERGLIAALESLTSAPGLWGPEVTIDFGGLAANDRLPGAIELALYRISQECISNARRHGGARRVAIAIETRPGAVKLTISDDGGGFDAAAPGPGEGLSGMWERVAQLGGTMHIDSASGQGTRVGVVLPLLGAEGSEG